MALALNSSTDLKLLVRGWMREENHLLYISNSCHHPTALRKLVIWGKNFFLFSIVDTLPIVSCRWEEELTRRMSLESMVETLREVSSAEHLRAAGFLCAFYCASAYLNLVNLKALLARAVLVRAREQWSCLEAEGGRC